jgi:acyl-CoA thioester hydrolase
MIARGHCGLPMKQTYTTSIFYEDTDCMGIVYHGSYVRFLERGRTELLDSIGPSAMEWMERDVMFAVHRVDATFRASARLRDMIEVLSEVRPESSYRLNFKQRVIKHPGGEVLVVGSAEVVCTNRRGELRELPRELLSRLAGAHAAEHVGARKQET